MTEVDREAILAERMEAKQLDEERKEIRALTHGRNPAAAPAKSSKSQSDLQRTPHDVYLSDSRTEAGWRYQRKARQTR